MSSTRTTLRSINLHRKFTNCVVEFLFLILDFVTNVGLSHKPRVRKYYQKEIESSQKTTYYWCHTIVPSVIIKTVLYQIPSEFIINSGFSHYRKSLNHKIVKTLHGYNSTSTFDVNASVNHYVSSLGLWTEPSICKTKQALAPKTDTKALWTRWEKLCRRHV